MISFLRSLLKKPEPPPKTYFGHRVDKILRFFEVVEVIGGFSRDPVSKVGSVALGKHLNILSTGWNGFARGVDDDVPERYLPGVKRDWTSHSEANLVAQATLTGTSLEGGAILVSPLFPCTSCANLIIQAGIKYVFAPKSPPGKWAEHEIVSRQKFKEAGLEVINVKNVDGKWVLDE